MKFVLFLATALFGQSISLTTADIMPEKDVRTGEFNVSFTIAELLGETSAKRYESIIASDETVEWEIFVPENYDPENPAGILAYISPSQTGSIPNEWKSLMDEHNVIRKMTHRNPKKARLQESDRIPRFTRVRLVSAFDPIADTEMVEF